MLDIYIIFCYDCSVLETNLEDSSYEGFVAIAALFKEMPVIGFLEFLALSMCAVAFVLSAERSFGTSVFMVTTTIVLMYLAVVKTEVFWIPSLLFVSIGYVKFSQSIQDARENRKENRKIRS